jgi:hypothetical protein
MWTILLKNETKDLLNYKFNFTYESKFKRNGDVFTTVMFNGVLATYVIDFDAERQWGKTYTPEHLLYNRKCLAEVLFFNYGDLCDDEVYEILIFNEHHKFPVSIIGLNSSYHCTSAPAKFNYVMDWKKQVYNMEDKEYYIDGKQYTEDEWHLVKRSMKIDNIKKNFLDKV